MAETGATNRELGSTGRSDSEPRALIHRKILDVAGENPEASVETIAESVSGASAAFVERVFDEYGDPAAAQRSADVVVERDGGVAADVGTVDTAESVEATDTSTEGREESSSADGELEPEGAVTEPASDDPDDAAHDDESESAPVREPGELTPKQRETLRAVADHPSATQREIAELLDVSRATVSKRVNDVPGFDWSSRHVFVDRVFGDSPPDSTLEEGSTVPDRADRVQELHERVEALEAKLADDGGRRTNGDLSTEDRESDEPTARSSEGAFAVSSGPDERSEDRETSETGFEAAYKALHAVLDAEYISREEELEIFRCMVQCLSEER